jgi:hypothetical protein
MRVPSNTRASSSAFAEAALRTIAQQNVRDRDLMQMFALHESPPDREILSPEILGNLILMDIKSLVSLGQQLRTNEMSHENAIAASAMDADECANSLEPRTAGLQELKGLDEPFYHMFFDSLHGHTPPYIRHRWNKLWLQMAPRAQKLQDLLRQAEEFPRSKWPPLVSELFHLLLEYVRICIEGPATEANRLQSQRRYHSWLATNIAE